MVEIEFLDKKSGEWFDLGSKNVVSGVLYSFKIKDQVSGEWILNVRIQDTLKKADVIVATSENVSSLHDQIKRKTITFNETIDGENFYNVIGLGYVENGRFHSERISDIKDVSDEIKSKFEIKKYQDVSPHKNIILRDKLVVLVDKNNAEDMGLLFFLERIKPVFQDIGSRPS
jgi:hypothetical protein